MRIYSTFNIVNHIVTCFMGMVMVALYNYYYPFLFTENVINVPSSPMQLHTDFEFSDVVAMLMRRRKARENQSLVSCKGLKVFSRVT